MNLLNLNHDVLYLICHQLDDKSLAKFRSTCNFVDSLCNNDLSWADRLRYKYGVLHKYFHFSWFKTYRHIAKWGYIRKIGNLEEKMHPSIDRQCIKCGSSPDLQYPGMLVDIHGNCIIFNSKRGKYKNITIPGELVIDAASCQDNLTYLTDHGTVFLMAEAFDQGIKTAILQLSTPPIKIIAVNKVYLPTGDEYLYGHKRNYRDGNNIVVTVLVDGGQTNTIVWHPKTPRPQIYNLFPAMPPEDRLIRSLIVCSCCDMLRICENNKIIYNDSILCNFIFEGIPLKLLETIGGNWYTEIYSNILILTTEGKIYLFKVEDWHEEYDDFCHPQPENLIAGPFTGECISQLIFIDFWESNDIQKGIFLLTQDRILYNYNIGTKVCNLIDTNVLSGNDQYVIKRS